MATIWVKEFTGGLDTRRMPVTTTGGVLVAANNGHINRGGEFEKRAAFVPTYSVPGTVGMAAGKSSMYTFGSAAAATVPPGITYQRLQHPDTVTALTKVLSADLNAGKLYVVGEFADGSIYHFYDGARVTDWYDGRARATLTVEGGSLALSSSMSSLTVDGIAISASVTWLTDGVAMAAAIATAINAFSSTPEYTATSSGFDVNIVAATPGAAANGRTVAYIGLNGFTFAASSDKNLSGGTDAAGTYQPGEFVKTIGTKMYSLSGPNMHFSGIKAPTKWTTATVGAGFIDLSSESSGSEELIAIARYQNLVAVFAEAVVQLWYTDPDPTLNRISQVMSNTGTISPNSVTQFGDSDLFYLNESGLRSLKARDASNAAATTDIGVPIDTLITEKLASLTLDERKNIYGVIEPTAGRFWLCMKDTIFTFSFFSGAQISAWSTYTPSYDSGGVTYPFNVESACVFQRHVYVRSGTQIYVYGGLGSTVQYDTAVGEVYLPYMDANDPTRGKVWNSIDAALEGDWAVYSAMDPNDETAEDYVFQLGETTYGLDDTPALGRSTHISLRFRTTGATYARVSAVVIHYDGDADEG